MRKLETVVAEPDELLKLCSVLPEILVSSDTYGEKYL